MVLLGELSESYLTAIQLSHNALVGLDDPQILSSLWAKVQDIQDRLYAGLSSDALGEVEKVKLVTFTTPSLATRTMDDAELVSILSQTEKNSLAILLQVVNTCQQEAMAQPPVPGSAMRLLKAQEALEKLKRLQASGSASSDVPAPSLGKLPAVEKYLSASGWKVKKSKLYQDKKKGLLKVQPDGTVLKLDADTYAAGNLAPADAAPDADDQETLRIKRELLLVDLETKRQIQERTVMRLQKERGDLVSREELDNILVSFVTVLRASLRQFFYMALDASVRDGVALGDDGEALGYWIAQPDSLGRIDYAALISSRYYPASVAHRPVVLHGFPQTQAEQYRGIPSLAPAMALLRGLADVGKLFPETPEGDAS